MSEEKINKGEKLIEGNTSNSLNKALIFDPQDPNQIIKGLTSSGTAKVDISPESLNNSSSQSSDKSTKK